MPILAPGAGIGVFFEWQARMFILFVKLILTALFTLGIGALLMYMEYRRWGRTFDGVGVTRNDAKQFPWADLQKKLFIHHSSSGRKHAPLDHVQLVFNDGKALVFPLMLENVDQVMTFLEELPAESETLLIQ